MSEKCENCFYLRDGNRCHRYAPKPHDFFQYYLAELLRALAWAQSKMADCVDKADKNDDLNIEATETTIATEWPTVAPEEWCGEWKKQSEKTS